MKSTLFLEHEGKIYVPRPTSVNAGLSRSIWIKQCIKRDSHVTHPDLWDKLKEVCEVKMLKETPEGFEVVNVPGSA